MITRNVTLWFGSAPRVTIPVSQYDDMWQFVFSIVNDSVPWSIPDTAQVTLNGLKPDGNVFAFYGSVADGVATVDCDIQMTAVAGLVECELSVLDSGKVVGTANFYLAVEKAPKADDAVMSESTLAAYGEVLDQISQYAAGFIPEAVKTTLLNCFAHVAWVDEHGQDYYDALADALAQKTVVSISAAFTQGSAVIYDTDALAYLEQYLVVTATYDDTTTAEVVGYTLSGSLSAGTSTITVTYEDKTTTFTVTVTAAVIPSGYRQADYIYSDSTDGTHGTYVKTNASFSSPTTAIYKCIAQLEDGSSINGHAMCTRQKNTGSSNATGFEMTFNPTLSYISSWSTQSANYEAADIFAKHTVIATWESNKTTVEVDGETPVVASGTTRAIGGYPICIFGAKPATGDTGGSSYYFFRGRIYYAEASQNGTTLMKCYPCVRKADDTPGFYDTINDAFYTGYSIGDKTIVAGYDE